MIIRLNDTISFPDPHLGDPDGFFAVGGDLSIDRLLLAYQWGIFPWYSMFSLEPSASKLALITLARYMQKAGGTLIDCQCETPHLRSMGGRHIPYDQYISLIQER